MTDHQVFVGGLSWETTENDLKEYFSKFGEVSDCTLKTDLNTGRSRGFGFISFTDAALVDTVLGQEHSLQGKNIDPKRAKAKNGKEPIKKIFVGGLDPDIPEETIKTHFEQYGPIAELSLPFDKFKQQRRAFCFVTFESEAGCDSAAANSKQMIGDSGKEADVKKAVPKNDGYGDGFGGRGGGRGGYGGGRGGGRGGYGQQSYGWGGQGGYAGGYDNSYGYGSYGNQGYDRGSYGQGYGYGNGYQY